MKIKLLLSFLVFSICTIAQEKTSDAQNMKVETNNEPAYPKGEQQLYMDVLYNTKYPEDAIKKYAEGEITISFDVNIDSTITNCIVITGIDKALDEAVIKYLKTLKFIPAKQNGTIVKMSTMYTFPVKAH